ncbi:RNA-binding protein 28 isoform X2 [Lingula anatina]|uniref:RNA-binding protein 28 isoform X2 n=1 Tax=Lingula anatina TaxID=7574 RepID=A0A1S3KHR5_LINAN|nr:RNA-binding protein 28 isoform X2 [Lingula anatina]|eukprot:XP_013421766.1 RNA-binding protein 28 isoform X2 [Lingula anatina]
MEEEHASKTLFIRNLPYSTTNQDLEKIFSDVGPLKQCFVVKDNDNPNRCRGFGYVTFSLREDAVKAKDEVKAVNARKLHITFADKKFKKLAGRNKNVTDREKTEGFNKAKEKDKKEKDKQKKKKKTKKPRLIIRNLPWKCTEEDLKTFFSKHGSIVEVRVPKKSHGKSAGFGFVEFTDMASANKAITKTNATQLLGRPVAVDWAMPKGVYDREQKKKQEHQGSEDDSGSFSGNGSDDSEEEGSDEQDSSDVDKGEISDEEVDSDLDDREDEGERSISEDEDVEEESDEGFTDDDDDDNDDDDAGGGDKEEEKWKSKLRQNLKSDVEEGRTVFIRNLSYDSLEEDVEEAFSEFGEINYVKIVLNPDTEHSKGLAFVQFKDQEAAETCLQKANDEKEGGGIVLDGRKLLVSLAVDRNKAAELKKKDTEKQSKDNRNLHLAREGMIRAGTQAAEGLSQSDLSKRMKVEMLKRQKLKNPNVFISPVRLCIRNLPVRIDDKELKKMFLKAAQDRKAKIVESRIMRDFSQVNSQGEAKSKGYGFVTFTDHEHALKALNATNNSPDLFGEKKRLIVEFSLENKLALQAKQKRLSRNQAKEGTLKRKHSDSANSTSQQPSNKKKRKKQSNDNVVETLLSKDKVKNKGDSSQKLPKGLPKHWGPKIRHKPRGGGKITGKGKKKELKNARPPRSREHPEAKDPSKKKKNRRKSKYQTDDFDNLVNKYRQKLMPSHKNTAARSGKWFA